MVELKETQKIYIIKLMKSNKPGYHIEEIKKGVLGESSKILEEINELIDSEKQDCRVMSLVELSDIIGAVESYLNNKFPSITVSDLMRMSAVTKRAFRNKHRK